MKGSFWIFVCPFGMVSGATESFLSVSDFFLRGLTTLEKMFLSDKKGLFIIFKFNPIQIGICYQTP